jgi:hypothetical protein
LSQNYQSILRQAQDDPTSWGWRATSHPSTSSGWPNKFWMTRDGQVEKKIQLCCCHPEQVEGCSPAKGWNSVIKNV